MIREEIRRKLAEMICGGDPEDGLWEFDVENAMEDVDKILKYLDKKNVRICRLPEVYGLVEHEKLVEE